MSLDFRYLTNGEKTLYCVTDSAARPVERTTYENIEDVPESIRHYAPKGEAVFVDPLDAQVLGFGDVFYPEYERRCCYESGRVEACVGQECNLLKGKKPEECEYWIDR